MLNMLIKKRIVYYLFSEKTVGIPDFWLQVLKNSDVVSELIKVKNAPLPKIKFSIFIYD